MSVQHDTGFQIEHAAYSTKPQYLAAAAIALGSLIYVIGLLGLGGLLPHIVALVGA